MVILLAEDNPGDIFLIKQAFKENRLDAEILVAQDGDELAALLERLGNEVPGPDLLLLDLNLPRISGVDLFRLVRAHPLCEHTPLIVVSSSDSARDRAWTAEFHVACYFRKPSNYEEFMSLGQVVRQALKPDEPGQKPSAPIRRIPS